MDVRYLGPPEISHLPETTLSQVHMEIEWVITPGLFQPAITILGKIVF